MTQHSDAWHGRMRAFQYRCRGAVASEQANLLYEALRIRRLHETDGRAVAGDDPDIERLLEQSAFECAALDVLGPRAEFELSCGKLQELSARVRLPGQAQFSVGEGRTIALALLSAWASAHLAETSPGPAASANRHSKDAKRMLVDGV